MNDSVPLPNAPPVREPRWYLKWWMVVLLLIALGPLAFPFLWKSKDFSLFWKWFLTLIFTALTVLMIWGTWEIFQMILERFRAAGLM